MAYFIYTACDSCLKYHDGVIESDTVESATEWLTHHRLAIKGIHQIGLPEFAKHVMGSMKPNPKTILVKKKKMVILTIVALLSLAAFLVALESFHCFQ